ncbi:oryzalexin E synthase-like [Triticum dicoccoides]|uniref:oryzalexin E synthase-like n=1 Tax=Triticum dicoccoides TaxID=85692 RepID=UPI00188E972A|nr:oryzalexin E synthase-like [Triticum dicoccoides]
MEASYKLWLVYVSLASFVLYKVFVLGKKNSRLPPGPTPIPLLGNIFDIQGDLHQALTRLAGVHGPIISIKLGATTAVVASSAECARDVLQKYDHLLAGRSVADAARALGFHERSIIWLPSTSPLWKRLRAVCTNHLFSAHGLDAARAVREEKVRDLVGCIRGHAGETVDVGRVVLSGLFNLVSSVLFSEEVGDLSSERAQGLETLIDDILAELVKPNLSDLFPVLSVLDLQRRRRRTGESLGRFFDFFDRIIDRRMKAGGERKGDFLDVLLQLHSVDQLSIETIKSFLLDLFIAGTETNSLTVQWAMAELLRHPVVMSKVRAELQEVLGEKQYPDESDISRLSYLRGVLMESMRLHSPSPLLIPHHAMAEGAEVGGFVVPKGATVIVNLWAVMRDPAVWTQSEEFMPERFIGADMDFRGKDRFEFMPFGAGRRACPGMPMATRVVTLILASLLHRFEWRLPEGMQPCDVDVRDRYRMSLNMVTPIKAVPLPLFS